MGVNWGLGVQQSNPGEAFANAFQQGMQRNEQTAEKAAMAALVQNPNDPHAMAVLAKINPQVAMQFRQQQLENAKAQLGQHYDNILKGAEILRQFNPKDQASYSAALQAAQQAGIDVSRVPQQYQPEYVAGIIHIADAFKPQPNGQLVPYTPGGGVARMNPQTHELENLVVPNPGGQQTGAPAVPQVHDQSSYDAIPPGSQYMGPDGHIRVKQGGQMGAAPSGGFQ